MTYDFTMERLLDAPPELVFDTIVDPSLQDEMFSGVLEGWALRESEIDLRVGGTWTVVFGPIAGGDADRITSVFTEIDRPRKLAYRVSMYIAEWGRTVDFTEEITMEEQDGKTLLTVVESGFETEEDRDGFQGGTPDWFDALQRVVERRAAEAG